MQSGPGTFDKSMFSMIFSTILGVTKKLCSFRLVPEGKEGKEIPKSSRLEFLANTSALSVAEGNSLGC